MPKSYELSPPIDETGKPSPRGYRTAAPSPLGRGGKKKEVVDLRNRAGEGWRRPRMSDTEGGKDQFVFPFHIGKILAPKE